MITNANNFGWKPTYIIHIIMCIGIFTGSDSRLVFILMTWLIFNVTSKENNFKNYFLFYLIFHIIFKCFSGALTTRKVSKYGVISGPCFPVFGLNTEIHFLNLRIQDHFRTISAFITLCTQFLATQQISFL